MEHLRAKFFESLSDELNCYVRDGRIYIREHVWSPEDILQNILTAESLENTFQTWMAERNESLVSKADDILREHGLEDRFLALSESHRRGAVFPFVGAGLSKPSGYSGWTDFLKLTRRQTTIPEAYFDEMLRNGQYEEAAEELANSLGPAFNEAVQNAFGTSRKISGVVQLMPHVFDTSVFTTNFDDVLKRCYDKASKQFEYTVSVDVGGELPRLLATGGKSLVKLHGLATTGKGRILTKSEYDRHYVAGDARKAIEAIFQRTLLFIGCGLSIDRTLAAMREIVAASGHDALPRHYAFLSDPGSDADRVARRNQLLECNIYPIWYPAKEDDASIEAFLTKLAESDL